MESTVSMENMESMTNTKATKEKSRREKKQPKWKWLIVGIAAVVLAVTVFWKTKELLRERKETEARIQQNLAMLDQQDVMISAEQSDEIPIAPGQKEEQTADPRDLNLEPVLSENPITYKGKTYRRNQYVKAILCMGIDRGNSMTEEKQLGDAGQSDGIFLIVQDTAHHTLKILMIPRDTMTEITTRNEEDTVKDTKITQLTMAFAYGDGQKESCENVVSSTEKLLSGFTIDYYMAVDISVMASLNDAVGGVTVTVPTDGMEQRDPAFIKGEQVTLHGDQAETFVRYRDINRDFSALYRMDQQQEYITQYMKALKAYSKKDSQIVTKIFDLIQDYMVTDMGKDLYLKIAMDALGSGNLSSENFYTIPGTGETTESFDVYHADRNMAIPILLNLFYREDK